MDGRSLLRDVRVSVTVTLLPREGVSTVRSAGALAFAGPAPLMLRGGMRATATASAAPLSMKAGVTSIAASASVPRWHACAHARPAQRT